MLRWQEHRKRPASLFTGRFCDIDLDILHNVDADKTITEGDKKRNEKKYEISCLNLCNVYNQRSLLTVEASSEGSLLFLMYT